DAGQLAFHRCVTDAVCKSKGLGPVWWAEFVQNIFVEWKEINQKRHNVAESQKKSGENNKKKKEYDARQQRIKEGIQKTEAALQRIKQLTTQVNQETKWREEKFAKSNVGSSVNDEVKDMPVITTTRRP